MEIQDKNAKFVCVCVGGGQPYSKNMNMIKLWISVWWERKLAAKIPILLVKGL